MGRSVISFIVEKSRREARGLAARALALPAQGPPPCRQSSDDLGRAFVLRLVVQPLQIEGAEMLGLAHPSQNDSPWELDKTSISLVCPPTVEPPFNLVVPSIAFITVDVCENALLQASMNATAKNKRVIFLIEFVLKDE